MKIHISSSILHIQSLRNSIHLVTPCFHSFPSTPPNKPLPLYRPLPPPPCPSHHLHTPHHAHYAPNPHPSPPAPKRLLLRPLHARLQIAHLGPKPHRHPRRPHRLHHHSSITRCRCTPAHRGVLDDHGARMDEHRRPPHGQVPALCPLCRAAHLCWNRARCHPQGGYG